MLCQLLPDVSDGAFLPEFVRFFVDNTDSYSYNMESIGVRITGGVRDRAVPKRRTCDLS